MQIVSEALLDTIPGPALRFASTHNRIAFVTATQLIVKCLGTSVHSYSASIRGQEVLCLSLQNQHYVVLLYREGVVEVRRVGKVGEILLRLEGFGVVQGKTKMRVTSDAVYVFGRGQDQVWKLDLCRQGSNVEKLVLTDNCCRGPVMDILVSSILQDSLLLLRYHNSINMSMQGVVLARILGESIDEMHLLYDPLLVDDIMEYVVLVEAGRWLKVYQLLTMKQLLRVDLGLCKGEKVRLRSDPLMEYLLVRVCDEANKTTNNRLLKINKQFYYGQAAQQDPFFLFDIELGLKQDLILFPTHVEVIRGSKFHSIDMLFFTLKEIRIATLVVDVNHRTSIHRVCPIDGNWKPEEQWAEIVQSYGRTGELAFGRDRTPPQLQNKSSNTSDQWDRFISRSMQQNLQTFKNQGIVINLDKGFSDNQRYLEHSGSRPLKGETEDALNTLSGSESYRSLGQAPAQELEQRILRMIQGDYGSEGENERSKNSHTSIQEELSLPEQEENNIENMPDKQLRNSQHTVKVAFEGTEDKMDEVWMRLQRIQDVHLRKIRNMGRGIRQHRKEVNSFEQRVEKWCEEEIGTIGTQIKQSLKKFTTTIGRLEMVGIRNLKRIKKRYCDQVVDEIETRQEKLEEHQTSSLKIENLMKRLGPD